MGLSDYERQVLAEMEAQLSASDPSFRENLASAPRREKVKVPARLIAYMFTGAVIGLVCMVFAVSLGYNWQAILVGTLGFFVVLFSFTLPWNKGFRTRFVAPYEGDTNSSAK
ncbi:MAG: DUF3040 domain-containing protein [Actinomycetaceae bacterium]|nr:DUF3040 domain-containing protein [Actinomycetaceae bacterium]